MCVCEVDPRYKERKIKARQYEEKIENEFCFDAQREARRERRRFRARND